MGWCRFRAKDFVGDKVGEFREACEAMAWNEAGGVVQDGPGAFASRVQLEIQRVGLQCGVVTRWVSQQDKSSRRTIYGWGVDCEVAYRRQAYARRRIASATTPEDKDLWRAEWKVRHKDLRTAMIAAKRDDWREFCGRFKATTTVTEVNAMWDRLRRVSKSGKGPRGASSAMMRDDEGHAVATSQEQAQMLTDKWAWRSNMEHPTCAAFSPGAMQVITTEYEGIMEKVRSGEAVDSPDYGRPFLLQELEAVLDDTPVGKATGWDGVPYELIKALGPVRCGG